eukprot:g12525.t1
MTAAVLALVMIEGHATQRYTAAQAVREDSATKGIGLPNKSESPLRKLSWASRPPVLVPAEVFIWCSRDPMNTMCAASGSQCVLLN